MLKLIWAAVVVSKLNKREWCQTTLTETLLSGWIILTIGMPAAVSNFTGLNYPNRRHAAPRPQPLSVWIILTIDRHADAPVSTFIGLNYPNHRHAAPRPQPLSGWIILTIGMPPPASTFIGLNYPNHRHAAPPASTFIGLNYPNHRHAATGLNIYRVELS